MKYTLIPGESQTASDEETMSMIRSVLTDTDTQAKPAKAAAKRSRAFVARSPDPAPRRRASDLPPLAAPEEPPVAPRPKRLRSSRPMFTLPRALLRRIPVFQPTTRHLAIVSTLLLLVVRPHWFLIGAVSVVFATALAFLLVGPARMWRLLSALLVRIDARDPARAARLRARLDRFANRWDAVLDLCPEGMVDALYMPDLQAMQQAELDHQTVVARRLDRMVHDS